jgi:hypothetical protein
MSALLSTHLGDSPYASLWEQFRSEPDQTVAELAGALEAVFEADPSLAIRLQVLLHDYYQVGRVAATVEDDRDLPINYAHVDQSGEYSETGTYLYGNVSPGGAPVSEDADLESKAVGQVEGAAPDVGEIVALFSQLYEVVEKDGDTSPAVKRLVRAELEGIATDMALGPRTSEVSVMERMCAIQRLSPGLYRDIIRVLISAEEDRAPLLPDVARRMVVGQKNERR